MGFGSCARNAPKCSCVSVHLLWCSRLSGLFNVCFGAFHAELYAMHELKLLTESLLSQEAGRHSWKGCCADWPGGCQAGTAPQAQQPGSACHRSGPLLPISMMPGHWHFLRFKCIWRTLGWEAIKCQCCCLQLCGQAWPLQVYLTHGHFMWQNGCAGLRWACAGIMTGCDINPPITGMCRPASMSRAR